MRKKLRPIFLMILILAGIAMSILNFSTTAYAQQALYGTTRQGDGTLAEATWALAGRLLGHWGGADWYCCDDPCNCCIVYAN